MGGGTVMNMISLVFPMSFRNRRAVCVVNKRMFVKNVNLCTVLYVVYFLRDPTTIQWNQVNTATNGPEKYGLLTGWLY